MVFIPQNTAKGRESEPTINIGGEMVALPPQEYTKYRILNSQEAVVREMGRYYYRSSRGVSVTTNKVRVTLIALYLLIYSSIKRSMPEKDHASLHRKVYSKAFSDIEEAYFLISDYLDKKKITMVDTKRNLDFTNLEVMNEQNNL